MTQSEKDSLRDYIVSYLIANSQTVNNLPDVTSLSGISSFPVIQQINGSNYIAKKVPFDMMITDFRYDSGYIQYKDLTTGNWINIISDEELASKIDLTNYVKLSDNQIVDGIKSFIKSPIVPTPINNSDAANKQYIDSINELSVHLIGDEVVEGIKTFSSSPIIPTPTIDMQASTKKYVDDISNEKFDKSSISQSTGQNITQVMSQKSTTDSLAGKADLIDGKIPAAQLPSYVDDVLEAVNVASFPSIGESGKIYVDTTTNITYRWTGSVYTEISKSLALGETSSSAYRGDRGKTAYDHSQIITGNPHNTKASDIANTTNGTISSTNVQAAINELDSDIDQVRADLNEKADKEQEQWITPTLMNGVIEVTPVRYMKDSFGFVHLKGVCGNVTQAIPMFNLPPGYRVEQVSRFPGVTNHQFIRISIATSPDGIIIPDGTVNNGMCSLDNIIFRARI